MAMRWWRIPLTLQVVAVVGLFVAASATLWQTGAAVVDRDRRRAAVEPVLTKADDALARHGAEALSLVPEWPETLAPEDWLAVDHWLAAEASSALLPFPKFEGGYYVPDFRRYLGHIVSGAKTTGDRSTPPPREHPWIEDQVLEALDRDRPIYVVLDTSPRAIALRTAPVWVNGRKVAATWTLTHLDEPQSSDVTIRGYQRAAGFAVGGIAVAMALALSLALTVRRQARERIRLQADLRRNERLAALGKLLAGVAHEVRNPLAGIRSTAQLWQRGIEPDESGVADVISEVDRLDGIVARLLQFSKADAHDLAPGDLNEIVAEAARLAKAPADEQGVRIEFDLAPSLPPVAMSPPALVQVFRNLTTNALHAMPRGGSLRFSTRLDAGRRVVEASVADTGMGLAPEVREHLFEPFHTTKTDGTGLGLAIAREIALAHRGDLRGENQNHGASGAVFTLALPIDGPRRETPR